MSNGSLPQTIPPQTASLGKADADGNVTIDLTWYLLFYNLSHQVLSQPNGAIPGSSIDLLLVDSIDAAGIDEDAAAQVTSDSADIDAISADIAKLRAMLQFVQALSVESLDNTGQSSPPSTSPAIADLAPYANLTIPASYGCIVPDYYEIANGFYVDVADTGVFQIE